MCSYATLLILSILTNLGHTIHKAINDYLLSGHFLSSVHHFVVCTQNGMFLNSGKF